MSQKSFQYAIYFLTLNVITGLLLYILLFRMGPVIMIMPKFINLYLLVHIIALAGSLFIIKYFHDNKYWVALIAGIVSTLVNFGYFGINYIHMLQIQMNDYLYTSFTITMVSLLLYGLVLVFTKTSEKIWIKRAGYLIVIVSGVLLTSFGGYLFLTDVQMRMALMSINQWTSWAMVFIPLPFIIQFKSEIIWLKVTRATGVNESVGKWLKFTLNVGVALALGFALVLGIQVTVETNKITSYAKQVAQPFEDVVFKNDRGTKLRYRLMKPLDSNPSEKYPLVVCLHGSGGAGKDNALQVLVSWSAKFLSQPENREQYPAFVFVPQTPPGFSWGGISKLPGIESLVFDAIGALEKEYAIDTTRRYVMGESMGGYGSWHFISTRPEIFAAAIPICGGGNPTFAPIIKDVPIWAFHGRHDINVPVSGSRDMVNAIRSAGGNPQYDEFPDAYHDIINEVSQTPGLLEWLFMQKKE